ncbi:MAG TPA: hypothetical protein VFG79_04625 [Solirubrobacter sp.]|nr:hypothetical protein [Solirubrobacter sp.]
MNVYVAGFVARCEAAGRPLIEQPGVVGLPPSAEHPVARLLVTDDRAYDALGAWLADPRAG